MLGLVGIEMSEEFWGRLRRSREGVGDEIEHVARSLTTPTGRRVWCESTYRAVCMNANILSERQP